MLTGQINRLSRAEPETKAGKQKRSAEPVGGFLHKDLVLSGVVLCLRISKICLFSIPGRIVF